jgi:hypothetical protein
MKKSNLRVVTTFDLSDKNVSHTVDTITSILGILQKIGWFSPTPDGEANEEVDINATILQQPGDPVTLQISLQNGASYTLTAFDMVSGIIISHTGVRIEFTDCSVVNIIFTPRY